MSSGSIGLDAYTRTRNAISSLLVSQLKGVLKAVGLPVSGTKGLLVQRLEGHLQNIYARNEVNHFQRLTTLITQPTGSVSMHSPSNNSLSYGHQAHTSSYGTPPSWHSHSNGHGSAQLNFKESIFYEPVARLTNVQMLKPMENTRATHEFTCILRPEWSAKFDRNDPESGSHKILLMGASDPASAFTKLDVAYPQQFEAKINGIEVRVNWKGLKGKPGTTKPADVTEFFRKTNNYENTITITYALTKHRFHLRVDLVKERSINSLVHRLKERRTITKEQVLRDMRNKAMDSDIVATSSVMSLKCPITYIRLNNPCRGNQCNHNQCFDAMSYLQLQQQAPTWTCPVCNKPATFDNLQIDQYVADILRSVSEDVEQVTIQPDGQWNRVDPNESNRSNTGVKSEDDSDEDLVEILTPTNDRTPSFSRPSVSSTTAASTPVNAQPSAQSLMPPGSGRNSNNKRPHEVVDLTLSDSDDDDGPPVKRASTSSSAIVPLPPGYVQQHMSSMQNGHRLSSGSGVSFNLPHGRQGPSPSRPYGMHNDQHYN